MHDPDFAYKRARFNRLWRKIRSAIMEKHPGLLISDYILRAMGKDELRLGIEEAGHQFFIQAYLRQTFGGKSGPPQDKEELLPYFDLQEPFPIIVRDENGKESGRIGKVRGDLTKADMIQLTKQKAENIKRADRSFRLWEWECSLLFPVFDEHPDWVYRDAFDVICTEHGGIPEPPNFK